MDSATQQIETVLRFFVTNPPDGVRSAALKSGLDNLHVRSLAWRHFFGILPGQLGEAWVNETLARRKHFDELVGKYMTDPLANRFAEPSPECNDPLSLDQSNWWWKHYNFLEIQKRVHGDIIRLFSEYEFFSNQDIRAEIETVCVIFSLEHPELDYQQGFHELVGILYYVLHSDVSVFHGTVATPPTPTHSVLSVLEVVLDKSFLKHDTYALFEELMKSAAEFFDQTDLNNPDSTETDGPLAFTKLMRRCDEISHRLDRLDRQLSLYMRYDNIQIAIFGTRYYRILFGREFPVDLVLPIWDAIFATGDNLRFADDFFLAMLLNTRDQILSSSQYSNTMSLLIKYPPVPSIRDLIDLAIQISNRHLPFPSPPFVCSRPRSLSNLLLGEMEAKTKRKRPRKPKQRGVINPSSAVTQTLSPQIPKNKDALMKEHIDRSMELLNTALSNEGSVTDPKKVVEAFAEIKFVDAIMKGLVTQAMNDGYSAYRDKQS